MHVLVLTIEWSYYVHGTNTIKSPTGWRLIWVCRNQMGRLQASTVTLQLITPPTSHLEVEHSWPHKSHFCQCGLFQTIYSYVSSQYWWNYHGCYGNKKEKSRPGAGYTAITMTGQLIFRQSSLCEYQTSLVSRRWQYVLHMFGSIWPSCHL